MRDNNDIITMELCKNDEDADPNWLDNHFSNIIKQGGH